jgi:amidase
MDLDIATASAGALAAAVAGQQISSRELLDALLDRGSRVNPALNAIVAWDSDRAHNAAAAADQATARGEVTGPLHGLPMTVKDVFETEGLVTTAGAPELARYVPRADAVAVARLKAAGAIVFGKTNTPLYAGDWQTYNDVYGRTNNPWDVTRTAGGSSGGAAAAVAAGLTPLEYGSDIGGSIRNPSHYNGVYGLKPSWGVVPVRGHIPGPPGSLTEPDVGVAGPIGRSVSDLRTALTVTAGPLPQEAAGWRLNLDPGDDIGDVRRLRIAVVFGEGGDVVPVAADVRACLAAYAARLGDAGARVEAVPMPVPLRDGFDSWRDLVLPIIGAGLPDAAYAQFVTGAEQPGESMDVLIARAMASRYRAWAYAHERREQQRAAWGRFFADYDAVLAPAMPSTAFPHDTDRPLPERFIDIDGVAVHHHFAAAWCGAIGAVLLPVVTLPAGLAPSGLPVGMQVIGPFLSDLRLLRIADVIEAAAGGGFIAPPAS